MMSWHSSWCRLFLRLSHCSHARCLPGAHHASIPAESFGQTRQDRLTPHDDDFGVLRGDDDRRVSADVEFIDQLNEIVFQARLSLV